MLPAGTITDRYGARRIYLIGASLGAAAYLITSNSRFSLGGMVMSPIICEMGIQIHINTICVWFVYLVIWCTVGLCV
jgi:MFS family permease